MADMLMRRVMAEMLGTGILVATVVGSGIMAERLAGGNMAVALLGNTIPTAAILVVLITIFGPVSGAHFNPVVSGVMVWRGRLGSRDLLPYCLAQSAGAILGCILANLMFDLPPVVWSTHIRSGTGLWLSEAVATACLILAIFGASRHAPHSVPMIVGLTIAAAYWFTASTSFANPAVTIGRAFSDSFAGIAPLGIPAFIAAQVGGAVIGLALSTALFPEE